jgi:hypothetical protein
MMRVGFRSTSTVAFVLICLLLAPPAFAVELFRYRGAAKDGGTLEYVFDTDRQNATATKEKSLRSQPTL